MTEFVEISLNNRMGEWYKSRGYIVPVRVVQLYANKDGRRVKNGIKMRPINGQKLRVKIEDLMPSSNVVLNFTCAACGGIFTTTYGASQKKVSKNCKSCQAKKGFKGGCHSYWVDRLIASADSPRCDISGESDKRFLELHHLLSRSIGGANAEENYVVLCANYHRAFHNWMGGSNVPTRPEDYYRFKALELQRLK